MSIDNRTSFPRAPRIKKAARTPISLSPDEFAQAKAYAKDEERSLASFMRWIYFIGLKEYLSQLPTE